MVFPTLTAFYAAILSLIFAGLSSWVVIGRGQFSVFHGDGGNDRLSRRIRAQGNFAEYVPLILLLIAFLEAGGANRSVVRALLLILVVVRIMHPIGMVAPQDSLQQYVFRGTSAAATLLILTIVAALLLLHFA